MHQLRRKLDADFIRNVRGVGYRIAPRRCEVDPRYLLLWLVGRWPPASSRCWPAPMP